MTLLTETNEALRDAGKTCDDVRFIITDKQCGTWAEFTKIANFNYDDGYGGNEIYLSLKIVGDDWWLERGEYDGSEWWEFKTLPVQFDGAGPLTNVRGS
jgi:hypothetical protein